MKRSAVPRAFDDLGQLNHELDVECQMAARCDGFG